MRSKIRSVAALATVASLLAVPAAASALTLIGSGSSAEQPVLNELFKGYNKLHKSIHFFYNADGGNAGVQDVQAGRSEFAVNTRPPELSDAGTTYDKLFLDGLCVAVNNSNSLSNASLSTVKNIFLGIDTSWSEVGGNLTSTIDPYGRNSSAGSYTFFEQAVLGGKTQSSDVTEETADGLVQNAIKKDKSGIGYVGLAHTSGIKPLSLNGTPCNAAHIKNFSYPLSRFIWSVLPTNHANRQVEEFLDWVRTNATAGTIIKKAGAVPAFNK